MSAAYAELAEVAATKGVDLRSAAFIIAIDKVARSYAERGIFP
jgi:glutamate dehydrogenase (NAD(P)+)